jgi:serine/threonine protein kinase
MTEREKRDLASNISDEALDFEGPEREGYVKKRCADDLELLGYVREYIDAGLKEPFEPPDDRFSRKRIGPYRLEEELGRGSMGIVYRGFDAAIGRAVAVKIILSHRFSTAEEIAEINLRFTREAAAAGQLAHSNIVVIYQRGEESGIQYMAMEFVPGVSLERMLKDRKPMELQGALSILSQIADALDFAHAQGVIHRDIKPANIMVRPNGRVTVTDFGIARIVSQTMTKIGGDSMGTPAYMAPEQILASKVDGKADQFSLSVIAYQMLSGQKPFAADTGNAVMYKITNLEPRALNEVNALLPSACAAVVHRALAKEPTKRYPSCSAFVLALKQSFIEPPHEPVFSKNKEAAAIKESLTTGKPSIKTSPQSDVGPPTHARRNWIAPAALLVITVGLLLAVYLKTRPIIAIMQPNGATKTIEPLNKTTEQSPEEEVSPLLKPDGEGKKRKTTTVVRENGRNTETTPTIPTQGLPTTEQASGKQQDGLRENAGNPETTPSPKPQNTPTNGSVGTSSPGIPQPTDIYAHLSDLLDHHNCSDAQIDATNLIEKFPDDVKLYQLRARANRCLGFVDSENRDRATIKKLQSK